MAQILNLAFKTGEAVYRVALDFDDEALMQDTIGFDVVAEREEEGLQPQRVTARVEVIPGKDAIVVYLGGREVFRTDVFDHGPVPAEQFVQALPASVFGGDPIIGCAVKAGVSSIIGQAIDCARSLEAHARWRVVADYGRCMWSNVGKISRVAMYRAFKCIVGLEF